ncbi:MAG: Crp/Fnr family transcriptional regulator [Bacteroidaceae bacterium]|nr:Crp/Fnr family transcriptional regulator [Bacteroidaceae bacterium]
MIKKEDVLGKLPDLTNALTPQEREQVLDKMQVRAYRKNEPIYREGDIPSHLLCLISGKVKIYKDGVGGRAQIVRVADAVEYFGYRAAFAEENYVTAASAFEPSVIASIPIGLIRQLAMRNSQLAWFFVRRLAMALGKSDARTVNLTQKHIRGRLAESILFLKESYGTEEDGQTLGVSPSREDMANLSNMTTSNAIRTLSVFAQEKLIALDGRRIKILNEPALQKISRMG